MTLRAFLFAAAMLLLAPFAFAADLSGTWTGSFDFQGSEVPLTVQIDAGSSAITGTVLRPQSPPAAIQGARIDGNVLTFWFTADYQGTRYKLLCKGVLKKDAQQHDTLEFDFGTESGEWATSTTLQRAPRQTPVAAPSLAGLWRGAFDFQGKSVPLAVRLKTTDGRLSGTVEGLPAGVAQIDEPTATADSVRFAITTEYQGSPVRLIFKGRLSGEQLQLTFGTEDGSWSTDFTAIQAGS